MVSTPTVFLAAQALNGWLFVHELNLYTNFNWNRAWNEYKMGFGIPGSNYWLGLEKLHQLTSVSTSRVRIEIYWISQDLELWLEMSVFNVASEFQYYKITWSGQQTGHVVLIEALPENPLTP
jgi:hypothetical protein